MCSSESSCSPAPRPLHLKMAEHVNTQMPIGPRRKLFTETISHDVSETKSPSPRLSPLIRQRASFFESPQDRSRAVVAMFVAEEENDVLIEISDDSNSGEDDVFSRPIAIRRSSRESMSSSIKNRISMFESPRRSSPQKSDSDSPSKRNNGFIQTKARLFEMMKTCKTSLQYPKKLISKVGGRFGSKKRSNVEKDAESKIDVEAKVRDVDELFGMFQEKTGKSPGIFGSLREKVKKSHRAHFLQKAKEEKREMAAKAYKEGLEKDALERKRVTMQVPNHDDETDNEEAIVRTYVPSSMTSAGLPIEQLSRRRSVTRSVHVAVDLPEDYMQSKKHANLIATCKQEYRCQSLDLPMDTEFPCTYSETVRMETARSSTVPTQPLKKSAPKNWFGYLQNKLHKRLSNVVVEEKPVAKPRSNRPEGLHFTLSLPPADFFAGFSSEAMMSESEPEDLQEDPFPQFNLPGRLRNSDAEDDTLLLHAALPTLRRLPSIRRLPSTSTSASSSSDTNKSRDKKKPESKRSKKEGDKPKKEKAEKKKTSKEEKTEKKKEKKKTSSKGDKEEKEKLVKTKSSSSSKKDKKAKKDKKKKKKKNKEEKTEVKKTLSFAEPPIVDFEMATMVRKLQDAREAAKNLIETVTDAAPRKPQRRPSLASCTDVGLELCHQLRPREAHLYG